MRIKDQAAAFAAEHRAGVGAGAIVVGAGALVTAALIHPTQANADPTNHAQVTDTYDCATNPSSLVASVTGELNVQQVRLVVTDNGNTIYDSGTDQSIAGTPDSNDPGFYDFSQTGIAGAHSTTGDTTLVASYLHFASGTPIIGGTDTKVEMPCPPPTDSTSPSGPPTSPSSTSTSPSGSTSAIHSHSPSAPNTSPSLQTASTSKGENNSSDAASSEPVAGPTDNGGSTVEQTHGNDGDKPKAAPKTAAYRLPRIVTIGGIGVGALVATAGAGTIISFKRQRRGSNHA